MFTIELQHFLFVSILLAGAGIATMLTKRNAIGILIGVELLLNAAGLNFVAFNRYSFAATDVQHVLTVEQYEAYGALKERLPKATDNLLLLRAVDDTYPSAVSVPSEVTEPVKAGFAFDVRLPAVDGMVFTMFMIVLAAAEAAIALAIFLNFYNNFSSIDVEKGDALKG